MELSDKVIQNLTALASNCLRGEKLEAQAFAMAELWGDVVTATNYLQRDKQGPCSAPADSDRA